jgi:hypothetical protein
MLIFLKTKEAIFISTVSQSLIIILNNPLSNTHKEELKAHLNFVIQTSLNGIALLDSSQNRSATYEPFFFSIFLRAVFVSYFPTLSNVLVSYE